MTSNSSTSPKGIRCSYLLFCKNGSILPLVAIDDLPPTVTVLPPLDAVNGITFVQEIPLSSSLEAPEMDFIAGTEKTKAAVTTTEGETVCSSVFQASSSSSSSPVPSSVVGRIRDAVQTRIVFPNLLSPPPGNLGEPTFALSAKSGMLHASPSHPMEPTTAPGSAVNARLLAPTRESLVGGSKPCPTYLSSGTRFWGAACTFHHDSQVPKSGRLFVTSDLDDDGSVGEDSAVSTTETLYSSVVEEVKEGNSSRDGMGKGKKLRSTEPCAYFHRKVGCKRGRDCFYAHGKDGSTSAAGDKHVPIQRPTPLTASNKKLEGEWRRLEPQSPGAEADREKCRNKEVGVAIDKKAHVSKITCPTPGRALSATDPGRHIKTHCTFFLRFGECDFWPACKFSHERPEGISRWRGSKLPSKSENKGTGLKIISETDPLDGSTCSEDTTTSKRKDIAEGQLISLAD